MALVVNASSDQTPLENVKPGNSVQISWDGVTTTYMVAKSPTDFAQGKIPLVNLTTGRLVFKPRGLNCTKVSVTINVEKFVEGNK